ncbi:MAG: ABC transporter substrate-binding protein [Acidimicrobiales bacterium]
MLSRRLASAIIACALASVACSAVNDDLTVPSTVPDPALASAGGTLSLRIGSVLSVEGPSAQLDQHANAALVVAARSRQSEPTIVIESITISEPSDARSAVAALIELGVTVVAAPCDPEASRSVIDAALEAELLAVTSCAMIPRTRLEPIDGLLDTADLREDARAIATWSQRSGPSVAFLESDLVADVETTCDDSRRSVVDLGGSIAFTGTWSGLVESPDAVVTAAATQLGGADSIVVCALPASAPDAVRSLREAGYTAPIGLPWFAGGASWPADTEDVFVIEPASSAGDDPAADANEFLRALRDRSASPVRGADIVAADAISLLGSAANRRATVGSRRLWESLLDGDQQIVTGSVTVDPATNALVGRGWRSVEVVGRSLRYAATINIDG